MLCLEQCWGRDRWAGGINEPPSIRRATRAEEEMVGAVAVHRGCPRGWRAFAASSSQNLPATVTKGHRCCAREGDLMHHSWVHEMRLGEPQEPWM